MDIRIDGRPLEHNIGDRYWYIWFSSETGVTSVRCNEYEPISEILIQEDGPHYIDAAENDLTLAYMESNGCFWSQAEAESWIKENEIPDCPLYDAKTELFIVSDKKIVPVYVDRFDFRVMLKGRIYILCSPSFSSRPFYIDEKTGRLSDPFNDQDLNSVVPIVFTDYMSAMLYLESHP